MIYKSREYQRDLDFIFKIYWMYNINTKIKIVKFITTV